MINNTKAPLLIDFDETLFNHMAYQDWLDGNLVERYGVEPGHFRSLVDEHFQQIDSVHRLYDHEAHVRAGLGIGWDEMADFVKQSIDDNPGDFCYPDAEAFLRLAKSRYDARILTYGREDYQLFKLSLCPIIGKLAIPVTVVDYPKADFIRSEYGDRPNAIVDDKQLEDLPPNTTHFWINRGSKLSLPSVEPNRIEISSLEQMSRALILAKYY